MIKVGTFVIQEGAHSVEIIMITLWIPTGSFEPHVKEHFHMTPFYKMSGIEVVPLKIAVPNHITEDTRLVHSNSPRNEKRESVRIVKITIPFDGPLDTCNGSGCHSDQCEGFWPYFGIFHEQSVAGL